MAWEGVGVPTPFLPADSPSVRAAALAVPFQRADELPVTIVASRTSGQLGPADQAAVDRAVTAVQKVPGGPDRPRVLRKPEPERAATPS